MEKNNYAVTVKLGHVGRNKFIIKTIAIKAENGKEAAAIARWSGRVKHHAKDAIVNVVKINDDEFKLLEEIKKNDPYFHCSNIQEQRLNCNDIDEQVHCIDDEIDFDERKQKRNERIIYTNRIKKQTYREYMYAIRNYREALAY